MGGDIVRNPEIVDGRFKAGNKAACGRTSRGQKLRAAVLQSISREDIEAVTQTLVKQAIDGDQGAAKILLGFIGQSDKTPGVAIQLNNSTTSPMFGPGRAAEIVQRIRERQASEQPGPS